MPENVFAAVSGRWDIQTCPPSEAVSPYLQETDLALIHTGLDHGFDFRRLAYLLDEVDRSGAVAVVLLPPDLPPNNLLGRRRGQYVLTRADASAAELAARIEAAAALQPTIQRLRGDVAAVRSFPNGDRAYEKVDEEMRLAARLQRDFLPRELPRVGPVRFATLFRPAGWLSGDMYDIFRLDEAHVGFYVADVVGHGMSAALLTMFIKKSLQTKRILGNSYEIVPPNIALALLNDDICQQNLTFVQFCTAVYGIVNTQTLELRYASGGHPAGLLTGSDGQLRELNAAGPLLGVFPGEPFEARQLTLHAGDRLVLFSDGAEDTLAGPGGKIGSLLAAEAKKLRQLPAEETAFQLAAWIDQRRAASHGGDDATVLIMDVEA
ncbi:MAG: hypothetical protein AMJ81_05020 [Phycisphaerae bacterium SM23_33]|nr:MAG: hypothetical protein AMJ81_05020 [Phycisphaerae bacterium SM23_33]